MAKNKKTIRLDAEIYERASMIMGMMGKDIVTELEQYLSEFVSSNTSFIYSELDRMQKRIEQLESDPEAKEETGGY